MFHSLQGEGPFSGQPAVFVRFSGCIEPLCPWCDTMYACGTGHSMSLDAAYRKLTGFNTSLIVVTGGEPFLQWHNGLKQLEKRLLGQGYRVQYETSGKIEIPCDTKGFSVCSPKYLDDRWVFDEINLKRAQVFKFVVDYDFDIIKTFIQRHNISPELVFIMPKGISLEEQLDKFEDTWSFCLENGFHFSPRLHVLTFNNKRGV
ncbi:7-carboxy-7-deazaguanine synthase QueE [Desulfobulbus marinus]|nr:7-carboxy-7-deazaguanine synthase QueE [Desulfogranum marinum]